MAPYVFFSTLLFFVIIPSKIFWTNDDVIKYIKSIVITIFKHSGSFDICSDHLWFLPTLALSVITCKFLVELKSAKQNRLSFDVIVLVGLGVIACLINFFEIRLPFRIQTVPAATFLVYMGKCYGVLVEEYIKRSNATVTVITLFAFIIIAYINRTVNMSMAVYNNFLLFVFTSICGIYGILCLCSRLHIIILRYIGEHSLIIFATHGVWILVYRIIAKQLVDANISKVVYYNIGILFVLFCSILSYCFLRKSYSVYFNYLKKILKVQ